MPTLEIEIPAKTLCDLQLDEEQMAAALRLLAAMKLYEMGKLSSGAAAEMAGIPKPVFLMKLADYGIDTFRQTPEELREEVDNAIKYARGSV